MRTDLANYLTKLFPRLRIRTKLVISFLLVGVLPLLAYGVYSVWSMSASLEEQALRKLQFQIDRTGQDITRFLTNVQYDLQYLKTFDTLGRLASLKTPRDEKDATRFERLRMAVERDFLRFARGKPAYYQLRYIDVSGEEVVRINRSGRRLAPVVSGDRQNKIDRYYVREGLRCAAGDIYVSPMDLNIERGLVEIPLRPVVRYATPVTGERGETLGLVVINIFARAIFEIIGGIPADATSFLTNEKGLYLYQSVAAKTLEYFRNRSLSDDYSRTVVDAILSGGNELTDAPDAILAHTRIALSAQSDKSWILIISVPRREVLASVFHLKAAFMLLLLVIAVVVAFVGVAASRHFVQPILELADGADMIARGNFDKRIEVRTRDEVEDLSRHFNTMARRLGKSQAKLKRWNEELQQEVQRRTEALTISEGQLRIEKQKLDDIISSIGAEICLIDRERKVVWANKTLTERCNGEGAPIGRQCNELFYGGVKVCEGCRCDFTFENRIASDMVISQLDSAGREHIYKVVSTPVLDVGGDVTHLLEVHMDITESVAQERALEKQIAEKHRLTSQVQMAAGVIHEVAKPLAAMKTTAQVLQGEMGSDEHRTYLAGIENKIDQLSGFLQTFSKYARPHPLTLNPGRISDVVRQVLLLIEKDAERRKIEIEVCGLDELPEIMFDSIQLQQVVLNVCLNAFDAMPGGGRIVIDGRQVPGPEKGQELLLTDTGSGIAAGKIDRVFEPFYSDKPNGTGLGLAIVKQIVALHCGEVSVDSREGIGTTFRILLPGTQAG